MYYAFKKILYDFSKVYFENDNQI